MEVQFSKKDVKDVCPDEYHMFNNCCKAHDLCYGEQLAQMYCDEIFCDCVKHSEGCMSVAFAMCKDVKVFGYDAYKRAGKVKDLSKKLF
uniref:Phospholipase A2 family protein n=1 Tax=Bursaphelenchus xylophilus TaxID=6326 RepID=A0A1I7S7N9_BURXY